MFSSFGVVVGSSSDLRAPAKGPDAMFQTVSAMRRSTSAIRVHCITKRPIHAGWMLKKPRDRPMGNRMGAWSPGLVPDRG
jgi:hypothetical protein